MSVIGFAQGIFMFQNQGDLREWVRSLRDSVNLLLMYVLQMGSHWR